MVTDFLSGTGRAGGEALCVKGGLQCMELTASIGVTGSSWVRVKGQTNNVNER